MTMKIVVYRSSSLFSKELPLSKRRDIFHVFLTFKVSQF